MPRMKRRISAAILAGAAFAGTSAAVTAPAFAAPPRHVTSSCDVTWTVHGRPSAVKSNALDLTWT